MEATTCPTEFVALGHAGSEHYAGIETFPSPGVSHVQMTSDELVARLDRARAKPTSTRPRSSA